jgi:hypothetical protein
MDSLGTAHIFEEVASFLPASIQKHVLRLRPEETDTKEMKEAKHRGQREYLNNIKSKLKPAESKAWCTKHECPCKVQWADEPSCPEHLRPIKLNYSGAPCVPWTTMGQALGYADPNVEAYNTWLAHTRSCGSPANLLDIAFIENSEKFPWDDFAEGMGAGFTCVKCESSLSMFGVPMHRPRLYGCAINNETLVWIGPTSAEAIAEDFKKIFARRVELDADDFAGIDTQHPLQVHTELAKNRGIFGDVGNVPIGDLLSPSQKAVWEMAKEVYQSGSANTSLKGCLVVDLSQSLTRARPRPWFSSQTKGTLTASVSKDHIFTRHEIDFAMGWPVIPTSSNAIYKQCVPDAYWKCDVNPKIVHRATVKGATDKSSNSFFVRHKQPPQASTR